MTLKDIHKQSLEKLKKFSLTPFLPALRKVSQGAMEDIINTNGCAYYQYTPGLIETIKPKQIVELGGAMGAWCLMVLNGNYQDFRLFSITLEENELEFSFIADKYINFVPVVGNDLDLKNWPDYMNLKDTDLWFFDSEHTADQLQAEIDLYSPYFKKGSVVLFDDIHMEELWPVWDKLPYEKLDVSDPLHYSGFGICVI